MVKHDCIGSTSSIVAVTTSVNYQDYLSYSLPAALRVIPSVVVVTTPEDTRTQQLTTAAGGLCFVTPAFHRDGAPFAKGKALNEALKAIRLKRPSTWILLFDGDILLPETAAPVLEALPNNPNTMYGAVRWEPRTTTLKDCLIDIRKGVPADELKTKWWDRKRTRYHDSVVGFFQLFRLDSPILDPDTPHPADHDRANKDDGTLRRRFRTPPANTVKGVLSVIHLPHGKETTNWSGRINPPLPDVATKGN